ncbi:hypothetical protein DOY81_002439 [Sarcophaga bullata]|nr:hypothetical protein DOY81_002439 [Sarcophaga bullata]
MKVHSYGHGFLGGLPFAPAFPAAFGLVFGDPFGVPFPAAFAFDGGLLLPLDVEGQQLQICSKEKAKRQIISIPLTSRYRKSL